MGGHSVIRQDIHIGTVDWDIRVYYAVTHYDAEEIMCSLERAGCGGNDLERAYANLSEGHPDTGICHTGDHVSVLVISVATSPEQFMDSLVHELHHLATQIATRTGMDLRGEDICYLAGETARKMFPVAGKFMCGECRERVISRMRL